MPLFFVVAKTVFSLDAAYNQFYFRCAVCSSCLNFAYCAITYVASGEYVIRTNILNYMPLVVSSEFGKSVQSIIPVKTISIYILKRKSFATVLHPCFIQYGPC